MNYYREIKEELINNEITKRVKDYSKNRSYLNTYYNVVSCCQKQANIMVKVLLKSIQKD